MKILFKCSLRTFSLASLMQLWNNSRIWSLPRQGSESPCCGGAAMGLRRMAAARAALAWARSSLSSLEPKKNGLVGDWMRAAMITLCLRIGLRASAIPVDSSQIEDQELGSGFSCIDVFVCGFSLHSVF